MLRAALSALAAVATLACSAALAQERVVNVYNWSDYIDPKVLESFTRETGIKVTYDTYDNNEIVETKLLAGKSGYDVVVPSGPFLQRLIQAGVFAKLDKGKLPNLKNMWPEVMQRLQVYDPGNQYGVNYMWGTTGIGLNMQKVRQRLGNQALNTWDLMLRWDVISKLKDCGVQVLDAPEDIFPNVLGWLGLNPDSKRLDDLNRAGEQLFRIRGAVQKFHSSEYINALANGDICMAVGYSGDVLQAKKRAEEAKNGVEIGYVIPREGALMWFELDRHPGRRQERQRGARLHRLPDAPRGRGPEHQFRRLRVRQPRREAIRQSGDSEQSRRLSGRGDVPAALHQHRL